MRDEETGQDPAREPAEAENEAVNEDQEGTGGRRRLGLIGRARRGMWAFFHPPQATWTAPGEQRLRAAGGRWVERMNASPGMRLVVAAAALVVVIAVAVAGWAVVRQDSGPSTPAPAGSHSGEPSASGTAEQLPGAESTENGSGPAEGESGEVEAEEPVGQTADEAALDRINEDEDLVVSRVEDEQDPLVTGARFLRSIRTVDTRDTEPAQWYEARDSFLASSQEGQQTDWGEAGDQEASSNAVVSWAEMDAALEAGRGVAPDFAYGPQEVPGTHLVQVGVRLEREITAGDQRLDTPSGALLEAVVVCPPFEGVDRCVVTDWSEEPSGFTGLSDEAWEPAL
ncbi:hypothetical protein FCK90_08565 [Kocuria coralli]|uniref:Uncharacterized protein n=1 Tax=Kocuria coralli TaxID=1461025 RepID=A0A5J5KXY4_9MICC|nr:hypothetical protein [Kocuria coralli]KAA9394160.1 hypothetical protein FCK90_08565 [Kocuria coralli]